MRQRQSYNPVSFAFFLLLYQISDGSAYSLTPLNTTCRWNIHVGGSSTIRYLQANKRTEIATNLDARGANLTAVSGSQTINVSGNQTINVSGNQTVNVSIDQPPSVSRALTVLIGFLVVLVFL